MNLSTLSKKTYLDANTLTIINRLRLIAITGQLFVITAAAGWLKISLNIAWLLSIVSLEAIFWSLTWWRQYRLARVDSTSHSISHSENFVQLLFNSLALSGLVYWSGGSGNPFIYFLLLDLALATIILKPQYLFILAVVQIGLYSLLHLYAPPLSIPEASPLSAFHLHLIGMWVSFIVTTALIVVFGLLVRFSNRRQQQQIQQLRENQMRDEQLLGIAVLAASAAHELGTPISTIATLLESVEEKNNYGIIESEDLTLLRQQVKRCREVLAQLKQTTQTEKSLQQTPELTELNKSLNHLLEQWQVFRPDIQLNAQSSLDAVSGRLPPSIGHALINLLNNAADASIKNRQSEVSCHCRIQKNELVVEIHDQGMGIAHLKQSNPGRRILPSQKGMGWGLFLSNASIERAGGRVELRSANGGGTLTLVKIPLTALTSNYQAKNL